MVASDLIVVGPSGFIGKKLVQFAQYSGRVALEAGRTVDLASKRDISLRDCAQIFWLASSVSPYSAELNPEIAKRDLDYFSEVLENLLRENAEAHVVLASSGGAVYADGEPPFTEFDPVDSRLVYANLKIEMENVLIESGLPHVILRIANAYGPGQLTGRGQGVLAEWISSLKNGDRPKLFGSMEVVRDFVHIDDVVKALWLAGQVKDFSGIINIGSGKPVSLKDCLTLLSQISDQDIEITTVESRPVDRARVYLSIDRAASVLNWVPEISLEQGLKAWWNDWEQ